MRRRLLTPPDDSERFARSRVQTVSSEVIALGYRFSVRITPRYKGPAVVSFVDPVADVSAPFLRQRRRLGEQLKTLNDVQWATASRCEGWSVFDVTSHLVQVNQFFMLSIGGALDNRPTRYLSDFDPVTGPDAGVARMRDQQPSAVVASYVDGVEELAGLVTGLTDQQWNLPGEAPPGHIALHAVVRHALWDAWVHERDILLPLGLAPTEDPDEMRVSLEYVAAMGPTLLAMEGSKQSGAVVVDASEPDAHVVIELGESVVVHHGGGPSGAAHLEGRTVELLEALSLRSPFPVGIDKDARRLSGALANAWDVLPQN